MRIFSAFLNIPDIQIKLVILTIPILFYIHRFQIFLPLIPFTLAYLLSAICYIVTMDMKKIEGTVFLENYTEMENLYTCDAHSHGMKFGDSGSSKRRRCLNRGSECCPRGDCSTLLRSSYTILGQTGNFNT